MNYWNTYEESRRKQIDQFIKEIIEQFCNNKFSDDRNLIEQKLNQFNSYYDKEAKSLMKRE